MKCVFLTVAYNAEKTIARAMNSVLNQTYKDWIYYVVDNGSTDGTNDIIKRYAKRNSKIKAYHVDVNKISTYVEYVNKILAHEQMAEGMCMLDADDMYVPDFLENAVKVMSETNTDMVILGTRMLDAVSLECKNVNVPQKSLHIDNQNMGALLSQAHWYLRQVWGKLWKISIMRTYDIMYDNRIWYGSDTIMVYQFLLHASSIYIMNKVGYQYYISPKSDSYTFNEKRVFSDQYLMKYTSEVLEQKCGRLSEENWNFLYLVYYNSLKDTLYVIIHAKVKNQEKISAMHDMVCNDYSIKLMERMGKRNQLFDAIVSELYQADIFENDLTKNLAGETFAILERFPKTVNGYSHSQVFELLQYIRKYCKSYVDKVDQNIEMIAHKNRLLYQLSAKQLMEISEIVKRLLDDELEIALNQIVNEFQGEKDISDDIIMFVIDLGLELAAKLKKDEEYVFIKKIQIQALIQMEKYTEAIEKLEDWDCIFPDDVDFIRYRSLLNEKGTDEHE